MTKKEIKGYIANGAAVDITNIPLKKAYELATHTTTSLSLLHGRIVPNPFWMLVTKLPDRDLRHLKQKHSSVFK